MLNKTPAPGGGAVRVLVLSPTRELASQIEKEAEVLTRFHNIKTAVVFGGVRPRPASQPASLPAPLPLPSPSVGS